MNSIPKYKAYVTDMDKVLEVLELNIEESSIVVIDEEGVSHETHGLNFELIAPTGFKDRNNVEIYESDIVAPLLNDESGIDYNSEIKVAWEVNGWNIGPESEKEYVIIGNLYKGVSNE